MRKARITSVLALAGVAVWTAVPGGALAAGTSTGPAATAATAPAPTAGSRSVTLITGDTVHVSRTQGQTTVGVTPAPGRQKIPFLSAGAGDDVRVVPADAAALLAGGRLDERLFDVSTLLKFGYNDTRRTLPLLIQGTAVPAGAQRTKALPGITAYEQDRSAPAALWKSLTNAGQLRSGVTKVWLDGLRKPAHDVSVPMIGAPTAWSAGLTGAGVKVAVLDSGVDLKHPDLAGQVAEAVDLTGGDDLADRSGHGTHVASTIAGTGAASGGKYKGVAPGAKLLSAKVCLTEGCPESAIIAGMSWAAERGATVANLSVGGEDTPDVDPLEAAVNDITARTGMLLVIAGGNSGEGGDITINSPGSADAALTVGDFAQQFASRYAGDMMGVPGPLHGDGAGHEGFRHTRDGSVDLRVYRNGKEVAQAAEMFQTVVVPPAAGDYRVTVTSRSAPQFTRSTLVDAEWTFRSAHVADDKLVSLPMTAIRFNPSLDLTGSAPNALLSTISISLDRQIGAAQATTRSLVVDASFDDGTTWNRLPVLRLGEKATALLHHPRGTGYVSLRASAVDTAGNTAKETIIRAYRYY